MAYVFQNMCLCYYIAMVLHNIFPEWRINACINRKTAFRKAEKRNPPYFESRNTFRGERLLLSTNTARSRRVRVSEMAFSSFSTCLHGLKSERFETNRIVVEHTHTHTVYAIIIVYGARGTWYNVLRICARVITRVPVALFFHLFFRVETNVFFVSPPRPVKGSIECLRRKINETRTEFRAKNPRPDDGVRV